MVKAVYQELQINHLVSFKQDAGILAACRENGKSRLFMAFPDRVYVHTANNWELLEEAGSQDILRRIQQAVQRGITIFHLDSSVAVTQGRFSN